MNNLCCQKLELGPISTNAFLLWEDHGKEAVLIDCPPFGGNEVKELLSQKNLKLNEIWLTHGHWDHIAGVREFPQFEGKLIGHPSDQILFEKPELMSSFSLPELVLEPVHITDWLRMDPIWTYGEEKFQFSTAQVIVRVISHFTLSRKISASWVM